MEIESVHPLIPNNATIVSIIIYNFIFFIFINFFPLYKSGTCNSDYYMSRILFYAFLYERSFSNSMISNIGTAIPSNIISGL